MHQEGLSQGSSRARKRIGWKLGEGQSARKPQTSGKQSPSGSKQTTLGVRQADVSPTLGRQLDRHTPQEATFSCQEFCSFDKWRTITGFPQEIHVTLNKSEKQVHLLCETSD